MSGFLRGDDEEVASFFAFQDVITAVLGILILIALQLSFSLNVTKGEKGNQEGAFDNEVITKQEFHDKQKERGLLENKLRQLVSRNREILAKKEAMESTGESLLLIAEEIRMLLAELEQLKEDRESLEQALQQKQESLKQEVEKLGLTSIQSEISKLSEQRKDIFKELASLKATEDKLRSEIKSSLKELSSQQDKMDNVWLIPEKDDDGKDALLITVDSKRLQFEEFNKPESLRVLNTNDLKRSFQSVAKNYDKTKFKIVFLFKPSGAKFFQDLLQLAKDSGFDVGYDPIEERMKIIFSVPNL